MGYNEYIVIMNFLDMHGSKCGLIRTFDQGDVVRTSNAAQPRRPALSCSGFYKGSAMCK